jgi:predicted methyltransferase
MNAHARSRSRFAAPSALAAGLLAVGLAGTAVLAGCASTPTAEAPPVAPEVETVETEAPAVDVADLLRAALAGSHRAEGAAERDMYRNPVETLGFFGLAPDLRVVEISPGAGWYTDVLAPVLAGSGSLLAGNADPDGPEDAYPTQLGRRYLERIAGNPDVYGAVQVGVFAPPSRIEIGEPGSADMVLVFRSVHGWVRRGTVDEAFAAIHEVLAPGGILGLVAHRAPPVDDVDGFDAEATAATGYLPEAYVIGLAEAAGFVLEDRSEVNANPNDTADHPNGVWSLPPTLRGGDEDRDRFLAIGESDRMTLRFVKPAE